MYIYLHSFKLSLANEEIRFEKNSSPVDKDFWSDFYGSILMIHLSTAMIS